MWFFLLIFIVALFFAIKFWLGQRVPRLSAPDSPLDLLKMRYAKGEIDEDEFQRCRSELEKQ
ncbi:MAG: SHOCT domain-containing protein [Gammaproteobacteria bacterium]|nr:SHOCT domain-containing protein [Gammaproteobacteria bacterium]